MADEQTAQATETAQTAQAATETVAETTTAQATTEQSAETVESLKAELARISKALRETNKESAERRKKLEAFEKVEQERTQANLSETEKLRAQIAERDKKLADEQAAREKAQADALQTRIKSAIMAQASALGFHDPEDAYNLIDLATVTVADDKVSGIKESLAALAKSKPYMLKANSQRLPQVPPTNPGSDATGGMTDDQLRVLIFGQANRRGFTRQEAEKHGGGVVWNKAKSEG